MTPDKCPHCGAMRLEGREYMCGFIFRPNVKRNTRTHECLLNSERSAHAETRKELEKIKEDRDSWMQKADQQATNVFSVLEKLNAYRSDASRWCPDRCPITFRPFFMWLEHPTKGYVPTYGGPFDSYTIPEPDMPEDGKKIDFHDIEFHCERYDHDEGGWMDGSEDPGHRVIIQDKLCDLDELETLRARVAELEAAKTEDQQWQTKWMSAVDLLTKHSQRADAAEARANRAEARVAELEGLKLGFQTPGETAGVWVEVYVPGAKLNSKATTLGSAMPRKEEK